MNQRLCSFLSLQQHVIPGGLSACLSICPKIWHMVGNAGQIVLRFAADFIQIAASNLPSERMLHIPNQTSVQYFVPILLTKQSACVGSCRNWISRVLENLLSWKGYYSQKGLFAFFTAGFISGLLYCFIKSLPSVLFSRYIIFLESLRAVLQVIANAYCLESTEGLKKIYFSCFCCILKNRQSCLHFCKTSSFFLF